MPDAAYYTVNISVDELEKGQPFDQVLLGKQGENGVRRIVIDCSAWGAIISNPSYSITARRAGESESYLANGVTSSGTTVTWVLSDEDTAIGGYGEAEIRASSGTDVKKSAKFRTLVKAGVENPSGNPPVTPPYWANTLIEVAEEAQEVVDEFPAVQSAAQTASTTATAAQTAVEGLSTRMTAAEGDITAMEDDTAELKAITHFENLSKPDMWEVGSISTSTGENNASSTGTRMRVKGYIPDGVSTLKALNGAGTTSILVLHAYDESDSMAYKGHYNGSEFVVTGTNYNIKEVDLDGLRAQYPTYAYRLVWYMSVGHVVDPATDCENILMQAALGARLDTLEDDTSSLNTRTAGIEAVVPKGFHTTWTNQSYSQGAITDDTPNRTLSAILKLNEGDTYIASGDARLRLVFYKDGVLQTATSGNFVSSYTVTQANANAYNGMRINVKQSADANIDSEYCNTHIFHTGSNEEYVSVDDYDPTVPVLGTEAVITAEPGKRYLCGTLTSLNFTPSSKGLCEVIFTSGSTQTTLSGLTGVKMPDWWTGTAPNRVYDIMILNGAYGVVTSWAT